jgi:chromosome partitioning protein
MARTYVAAVLSQKGGTGKTTTTLDLAVAAVLSGKTSVVIDLDPQASAAGWKDSREAEDPVVVASPASRLQHALKAAGQGGRTSFLSTPLPTTATRHSQLRRRQILS